MTLVERLREHGSKTEMEAAAEIERLEAEIVRLNDGLGQLATKATEVELAIVELKKANDELGLVLNPTLSFAEVRRELKRRAVALDDEMKRSFAQIRDDIKRNVFG